MIRISAMSEKTILSCIQPTGEVHLGNYFGAVRNWVGLQAKEDFRRFYGVVDLHAMTMAYKPAELKKNTENLVLDLLAAGVDPKKSTLFIQSLVPEHTELYWVFSCLTSYGDLTRQTQFKDKSDQLSESSADHFISAGLFTYPTLQAADILVYRAGFVPVGKDQEQHLELSRTIALRFNRTFGEDFFPEPQALSTEIPKVLSPAAPDKKMSKSLGPKHYIGLFEEEKSVRKKIKSAVTDSGDLAADELSPGVENLITLIRACGESSLADDLTAKYRGGGMYGELKETTADIVANLTNEMRRRREELVADRKEVMKLVQEMSDDARDRASETLKDVRRLAGLPKQYMFFQYPHRKQKRAAASDA